MINQARFVKISGFDGFASPKQSGTQKGAFMIITIANQKGGVGKTTTTINLGAALSLDGHRVLLIDLDPQGNTSMSYLDEDTLAGTSTYNWLLGDMEEAHNVIRTTSLKNLGIAPAHLGLARVEAQPQGELEAPYRLKDILDTIRDRYDFILIDTPPTLGLLTVNALVASSHVIIPIQSSYFAMEGSDDLLDTIEKIKRRTNPNLQLLGVLVTMYDKRTVLGRDIHAQIEDVFGQTVFETVITRSIRLEESPAYRESIFTFAPKSTGAEQYKSLGAEVLRRVS